MDRRMGADPRIIVLGEDVHKLAAWRHQRRDQGPAREVPGARPRHPDQRERVFYGPRRRARLDGRFKPVVEFMYPDFMWVAADQVFNQIGKARHMFGGDGTRCPGAAHRRSPCGSGYGSQHLMDPAGIFATSAGAWRIMAASTCCLTTSGLMNAALAADDPVSSCSSTWTCTGPKARSPSMTWTTRSPSARRRCAGLNTEVTVLTYLSMVARAAEAIERTGIDAELIDLQVPRPGLAGLDDRRRVGQEDQRGADRRVAGHLGAPPTAAGRRTRYSAGSSRLARPACRCSGWSAPSRRPRSRRSSSGPRSRGPSRSRRAWSVGPRGLRKGAGLMATVIRMPSVLALRDRGRDRALARLPRRHRRGRQDADRRDRDRRKPSSSTRPRRLGCHRPTVARRRAAPARSVTRSRSSPRPHETGRGDTTRSAGRSGPGEDGAKPRTGGGAVLAADTGPTRRRTGTLQAPRTAGGSSPARSCASWLESGASTSPG